jgi:hypothetical protein
VQLDADLYLLGGLAGPAQPQLQVQVSEVPGGAQELQVGLPLPLHQLGLPALLLLEPGLVDAPFLLDLTIVDHKAITNHAIYISRMS